MAQLVKFTLICVILVFGFIEYALGSHHYEQVVFDPPLPYEINVDEGWDNQLIWMFQGYDPYNRPFNFTLDLADPVGAPFTLDLDGKLYVDNGAGLNAATQPTYNLTICATNDKPVQHCEMLYVNVLSGLITPDLPDLPGTSNTVDETDPVGTTAFTVIVKDADSLAHIFSIYDTNPASAPFTIDATTGVITTTDVLDYETQNQYELWVMVSDETFVTMPEKLTINIQNVNEQPILVVPDDPFNPLQVSEAITGTVVLFPYDVTDPDGDTVTKTMTCIPTSCPFTFNAAGFVADTTMPYGALDFETDPQFTVTIEVDDGNGLTDSKTFTVDIIDQNEIPVISNLPRTIDVWEDAAGFKVLHDVDATDTENNVLSYYISVGPAHDHTFGIDNATGEIWHRAVPEFDYEKITQYNIDVYVTDGENFATVETLTVNVLDRNENPVIHNLPLTVTVSEDTTDISEIFQLFYDDEDVGDTHTITMGNAAPISGIGKFTMDADGVIKTIANPGFDYAVVPSYSIPITVTDNQTPALSDTEYLTVLVDNVNYPPRFDDDMVVVTIDEEQVPGTGVAGVTINAVDPDSFDVLSYGLSGARGDFTLDTTSGTVTLMYNGRIDYDTEIPPYWYNMKVSVTDPKGEKDMMTVTVIVNDINDNTPSFVKGVYQGSVTENEQQGTSLLRVSADDIDSKNNGAVTYYIDPADSVANTYFKIDAQTGMLSSNAAIDYETYQTLSFDVYATDGPGLTSTTRIDMTIQDQNDNAPTFSPVTLYNFEVPYDAEADYHVGTVSATDPDSASVTVGNHYIMHSGSNYFRLDAATGKIFVKKAGFEIGQQYVFTVRAKDLGGNQLRSVPVTVRVDAFETCNTLYNLRVLIAPGDLKTDAQQAALEASLQSAVPSGLGRLVYIEDVRPDSFTGKGAMADKTDITVLYISGTDTNFLSNVNVVNKTYSTATDLDGILGSGDGSGDPSAQSLSLNAEYAEAWDPTFCEGTSPYWWTETGPGIFTLSLLSMLGAGLLGALLGWLMYRIFLKKGLGNFSRVRKSAPKPVEAEPNKEKPKVPEGDPHIEEFRYRPRDSAYTFRRNVNQAVQARDMPDRTLSPVSISGVKTSLF